MVQEQRNRTSSYTEQNGQRARRPTQTPQQTTTDKFKSASEKHRKSRENLISRRKDESIVCLPRHIGLTITDRYSRCNMSSDSQPAPHHLHGASGRIPVPRPRDDHLILTIGFHHLKRQGPDHHRLRYLHLHIHPILNLKTTMRR